MVNIKFVLVLVSVAFGVVLTSPTEQSNKNDYIGTDFATFNNLLHNNEAEEARGVIDPAQGYSEFEQDLESIFTEALNNDWKNSQILFDMARLTPNTTVKWVIYNVLWVEIATTNVIYNPFSIIHLCVNLQQDLGNLTKPLTPAEAKNFANLKIALQESIITRGVEILEGPFHARTTSCRCEFPVVQELLSKMQALDDNVYDQTIDLLFVKIDGLETPAQIAQTLTDFSPNTRQSVVANLKLVNRTNADDNAAVNATLETNLFNLTQKPDFEFLAFELKQQVYTFLEQNGGGLDKSIKRLCFRNATNNTNLYECDYDLHLCSQPKDRFRGAFIVVPTSNGYAFLSKSYNRYIVTQPILNQTKPETNVYGGGNPYYWHIPRNSNGLVSLLDASLGVYLCSGSSEFASDGNAYAYTRKAHTFLQFQNECEWTVEDCS